MSAGLGGKGGQGNGGCNGSSSDSDAEPATKDDILTARRLAAEGTTEGTTQRATAAFSIAQVDKVEAVKRQVPKDIADREFERRWRDMAARPDPGPAAPRDGPKDVSSEEKTGVCHAAHFRSARKRSQTHVAVHAHGCTQAHATQAHASARTWTGTC